MTKHIPNFITLLNLFSGCVATVFAVLNHLEYAALFVFIGIFFDFFDGFVARLLNAHSEIGVQLDSLADMVTSGLVPGIVMFQLMNMALTGGWNNAFLEETELLAWKGGSIGWFSLLGFIITMASAYRLANFNVDENQVSSFSGLPTPANALLILSLPLILLYQNSPALESIILNEWFLVLLTLVGAFLLNAKIKLFALKFEGYGLKENGIKYSFILLSLILLILLRFLAIPIIILLYILFSQFVKFPNEKTVFQ